MLEEYLLIDFVDLNMDEKRMVLDWRNDSSIRKWMNNQEEITLEKHLNFLDSLKDDDTKRYFLVREGNRYIGVVDFINIDRETKECEIGLYANPFDKVSGVGRVLGKICLDYAFEELKVDRLKLEVFGDNKKALKLYNYLGFKELGKKDFGKRVMICMELERENRKV